MADDTDAIKAALTKKNPLRMAPPPDEDMLKVGCTTLDLALSGRRVGGFAKGHYFWICGESASGKTFLALTCLAEAAINDHFDKYRLIFDNPERGALMDVARYFGPRMAARLEPAAWGAYDVDKQNQLVFKPDPKGTQTHPAASARIEDFYYNLDDALNDPRPCIYILDSMDSLDSKYAAAKFHEAKTAARSGTKAKGDYGDGKAKINSTRIRTLLPRLAKSNSILIIISQTRDNIDGGMFDEPEVTAGGRAMKFYAAAQLWASVGGKIKKTVAGREVQVGVYCRVRTKKNRFTGRERSVTLPIYYDTGIDDIGAMVEFLAYWKLWPKNKQGFIDATADFDDVKKRREDLIQWLDENNMRDDLEDIVQDAWADVERRLQVKRRSKYE